ncbi:hypothetical protein [Tepidimonas sp.]|uniref:hypothetical protein n=1 Tax=Tepidimonas sp. TaxID=2002775 RepID=UPI004054E471
MVSAIDPKAPMQAALRGTVAHGAALCRHWQLAERLASLEDPPAVLAGEMTTTQGRV